MSTKNAAKALERAAQRAARVADGDAHQASGSKPEGPTFQHPPSKTTEEALENAKERSRPGHILACFKLDRPLSKCNPI